MFQLTITPAETVSDDVKSVSQTVIDGFIMNEVTADAEIMWSLDVVMSAITY